MSTERCIFRDWEQQMAGEHEQNYLLYCSVVIQRWMGRGLWSSGPRRAFPFPHGSMWDNSSYVDIHIVTTLSSLRILSKRSFRKTSGKNVRNVLIISVMSSFLRSKPVVCNSFSLSFVEYVCDFSLLERTSAWPTPYRWENLWARIMNFRISEFE